MSARLALPNLWLPQCISNIKKLLADITCLTYNMLLKVAAFRYSCALIFSIFDELFPRKMIHVFWKAFATQGVYHIYQCVKLYTAGDLNSVPSKKE